MKQLACGNCSDWKQANQTSPKVVGPVRLFVLKSIGNGVRGGIRWCVMKTVSSISLSKFAKSNASMVAVAVAAAMPVAFLVGTSSADDDKEKAAAAAEETDKEATTFQVANHTFSYSKPWVEKQVTSPMRAAELSYDHEDEKLEDLSVAFFHMGGTMRQNLDRWIGQFAGAPKVEEEEMDFDGTKVVMLVATGTYNESSGGPFSGNTTPREDYTMLGAVVGTDTPRFVFLKMAGPSASVAAMKEDFKKLLISPFEEK